VNLAPGYRELAPPPELRGLLECVWVRVAAERGEVQIVPDGAVDVVWQQGRGAIVAGPDTAARAVTVEPGAVMVGVRSVPGAGGGLLGIPVEELRDVVADAADVDRAFAVEGARDPADALVRLLAVARGRRADPLVMATVPRLERETVRGVADDLGIGERQLRRRFHVACGYGPKTLERVLRFRRFLAEADRGRTDLAWLALDAGYADQAHLTRESSRLAGLPPAALLRRRAVG
jgi:AraC-like DNA-binding protein